MFNINESVFCVFWHHNIVKSIMSVNNVYVD